MTPSDRNITQLLIAWSNGDQSALDQLIPIVHAELHRLAKRCMNRESPGRTLQTTELVNEAYLRLVEAGKVEWQNRAHFFAVCAQLMRRILVDFARARHYQKRGGGAVKISLDEAMMVSPEKDADLIAIDDALRSLAAFDQRKSQVVELRFFGGLNVAETAEVLKVSQETVLRDWRLAKVWLLRELTGAEDGA